MPVTIMAKNYSHCPLKKRPIIFDDIPDEPENLSTKPEDLSRKNRLASISPVSTPTSTPSPSPDTSITSSSPRSTPPISSPSPTHFMYQPSNIKMETTPFECPVPEYAPQNWHRQYNIPSYYYNNYENYGGYNENSHYHHQIHQPLAIRPVYHHHHHHHHQDQNSLSPNSNSTASPPPQIVPSGAEDLDKKLVRQSVRHQCPDCGKSYSTFSGLSKHRQFHCAHGDGPKKSFSCKYCDKIYVSLGALKMHIRTHTLPCKCTICGKAFSRPWLLQGHIRTHTGEKPFSCTYCNRAFADRSNLRAHLQTHSDVKKYSCQSCSKTFSRMSLLTKHAEGGCGLIHNNENKIY